MLKASDLIGKPIIAYTTGKEIDRIDTLVSDPFHYQIVAFVVRNKCVLPWSGVHRVEPLQVIARSPQMIVELSQLFEIRQLLDRPTVKPGTRIMTTTGQDLGTVKDMYFDVRTGSIEGYDVIGSVLGDPDTGRAFVPASHLVRITAQTAFVVPRTLRMMEEWPDGIGPPDFPRKPPSSEAVQSALKQIRQYKNEKPEIDAEDPTLPVIKPATVLDRAKGRRVRWDLRVESGKLIAAARQIVTTKVIERARAVGKERELLESVGLGVKSIPVVPSIEMDRERIKQAMGHPVTRTIYDREHHIILYSGQAVTYESIIHAQQARVLESLLDAVSASLEPIEIPRTFRRLDRRHWKHD